MRRSRFHILMMALVMLTLLASCRQELCYDHYPAIDLRFAWEQEWERDYGSELYPNWDSEQHGYAYDELRPSVPEWVKMVRYFSDGRYSERFFTPEGSKFEVKEGEESSILCYNGDTEYVIFSDVASMRDVRATATSRTRSSASLQEMQEMHQSARTTNSPDVIYSAFIEKLPGVSVHEVKHLPVKMQPLVFTYLVSFEFEHGLDYVALARGALGGMAEGVYLRTGITTDESSIILFDCDLTAKGCRSQVRSFGIPGFPDSYFGRAGSGTSGRFSLNLEVKLKNSKTLNFNYDITDQIKNQPRGGIIRITGVRVEDEQGNPPPPSSSGFEVDVTEWDDNAEVIDLPLNSLT